MISKSVFKKRAKIVVPAVLLFLVLLNGLLAILYNQKTYPHTVVAGRSVGSVGFVNLPKKAESLQVVPQSVTLVYEDQKSTVKTAEFGITIDGGDLKTNAKKARSWLPLLALFSTHHIEPKLKVDTKKFQEQSKKLEPVFRKDFVNAKVITKDGAFVLEKDASGYELHTSKLLNTVVANLESGHKQFTIPVKEVKAAISAESLQAGTDTINKQVSTEITLIYESQRKTTTAAERAGWFVVKDASYDLSIPAVRNYIQIVGKGFGITVGNATDATNAVVKALQSNKKLDVTLTKLVEPAKSYTYCVALRGLTYDTSVLEAKLAQTYADPRGWSLNGAVQFIQVASGCDFTVWLSSASEMPSFGGVCDSSWSCRIGNNVVINADRWNNASDAWNAASLALDDYRSMVINHETGHWFEFGHSNCPGAGQLAPVMQQQSISLQGCSFNPWPLPSELSIYRRSIGL